MTFEQIENLTIEGCLVNLKLRILDEMGVDTSNPDVINAYEFTEEDLQIEFEEYIDDLMAEELERLAEIARMEDIHARLALIKDLNYANIILRPDVSNAAKFVKINILLNNDHAQAEELLAELEAKDIELQTAINSTEYKEDRKKEYPSIEEILHIILDHGTDSQEYIDLQAARAAIKLKYPKPGS